MGTTRVAVALLMACVASFSSPIALFANGVLALVGSPQVSPSQVVAGQGATVTVTVKAGGQTVKPVQLQIRLGNQSLGQLSATSLGPNQAGTFAVPIVIPGTASGSLALTIWGQGAQIGQMQAGVRPPASASTTAQAKPQMVVTQVLSVTVDPTVVQGGVSFQGTVTLQSAAPAIGATVTLTSSSAGVGVPSTVAVPAGASSVTFTGVVTPSASSGSVTITAVSGAGTQPKQVTLAVGAAAQVQQLRRTPGCEGQAALVPGSQCMLEVLLEAPATGSGIPVALGSGSGDVTVPATVTVAGGTRVATFTATVSVNAAPGSVAITAIRTGPGVSRDVTLTLRSIQVKAVGFGTQLSAAATGSTGDAARQIDPGGVRTRATWFSTRPPAQPAST